MTADGFASSLGSGEEEYAATEDDGPECDTCGKADCPDASLPEFSEPRACAYAAIYRALRDAKDCDYGCARDYTNQAVRVWIVEAVEQIVTVAAEKARADERERIALAIEAHADATLPTWLRDNYTRAARIARSQP